LFLNALLGCAASQRATARVFKLVRFWLPGVVETPCANTGRLWLLRLGLHELTREKERADDWIWIMDQTLQLGPWKCLIIVGVRLSAWRRPHPLRHEDLTLLNLTPMDEATGDKVHQAMAQVIAAAGVPRGVVSDGGGELQRGMDLLQAQYPNVARIYDVKHKMALLLKKELEADSRWDAFTKQSNQTKRQITQTELAFLVPPSMKTKARYMNLETLVGWGRRVLHHLLDDSRPVILAGVDLSKLEAKIGWLREYREALEEWSQLLAVAEAATDHVRRHGYHSTARGELSQKLANRITTAAALRMRDAMLEFVEQQSAATNPGGEHLIGSSEILESLIGKYKQLQSTHSKGGMTAMLLSLGAIVSQRTHGTIREALGKVRSIDVSEWCRQKLGITLQALRKLALERNKTGIHNELDAA